MKPTLSEDELAMAVGRWMLLEQRYDGVGKQVATHVCQGIADVLGIRLPSGEVTIVEIKRSFADFRSDDKVFNSFDGYCSAAHRCYIACEEGLIIPESVPHPWGLIWVEPIYRNCVIVKRCKKTPHVDERISMEVVKALLRNLSRKRLQMELEQIGQSQGQ